MSGTPKGTKLKVEFEKNREGTFIAVGDNSDRFNTMLGTIVSRNSYYYASWNAIPEEHKSTIWLKLETYFDVGDYIH